MTAPGDPAPIMIDPGPAAAPVPLHLRGRGDSALDEARRLGGTLPPFGSLLMASQTAGRGRGGSSWASPPGHLYGALRLPHAPPFDSPGAALGLAWFMAEALADLGWPLEIKWPNDLLFEGGKAGGILLEARGGLLLAGVGLNLEAPPPKVARAPGQPPASALPGAPAPETLWPRLVKKIILLYNDHSAPRTMAEVAAAAEARLWRRRQIIRVLRPAAEPPAAAAALTGRLAGLGPDGQLLLDQDGRISRIWSGTLCLDAEYAED